MPYAGLRNIPRRYQRGGYVGRYQEGGGIQPGGGAAPTPSPQSAPSLSDLFDFRGSAFNMGTPEDAQFWNAAATPENLIYAVQMGGQLKTPSEGSSLQSSGSEGGWFPSDTHFLEDRSVNALYHDNPGAAPARGMASTNNWRLLPAGYQNPR